MIAGERIGVVGFPSGAEASAEQAVLLAKQRRRRQAERACRLVHEQALDLLEAVGILNGLAHLGEMALGADEFAVEQAIHQLGRELVPARDQVDETGSDHDPGPVGHVDVFVDHLDLLVEEQHRRTEEKAKGGRPAERDPDIDHGRPAHRFDDEQAEDPVDEEKRAGRFLLRLTASEKPPNSEVS